VVSDHVQEGLIADEVSRAVEGVAVSARPRLRDEAYSAGVIAGGLCVACLVTGPDNDTNLPNIRSEGLLDQDT
jgi:hypothetical protein